LTTAGYIVIIGSQEATAYGPFGDFLKQITSVYELSGNRTEKADQRV
jgi:hypothetical protein